MTMMISNMTPSSISKYIVTCFEAYRVLGPTIKVFEYLAPSFLFDGGNFWIWKAQTFALVDKESVIQNHCNLFVCWISHMISKTELPINKKKCEERIGSLGHDAIRAGINESLILTVTNTYGKNPNELLMIN
jgi:hypothetical protein